MVINFLIHFNLHRYVAGKIDRMDQLKKLFQEKKYFALE